MDFIIIYLIIINIIAFLAYGLDKWKAKRGSWRIPEKTLLLLAVFGGSIGAFAGMRVFHHKTQKAKFFLGVPIIFVLQIIIIYFLFNR
ncbi:MAG: DUF1294 domain-containing protein [Tyzzerella sp.]|nr:DUF1294 domain-containing protein [Tyzzerella sp.]